jgi:ABC-type glycerol-3-phosphate transport system substrate-binding protein
MNLRPFEIGLIAFFGIAAIAGVIIVSVFQAKPSEDSLRYGDRVVIWGTLPQAPMDTFLNEVMNNIEALRVVSYMQIDERTFEQTLVNAIAEGRSPDMVIIPHSLIVSHRAKLTPISLETITPRMYRDSYIDGADIFMMSDGVYGVPFAVDPMVMYWNREMFSSSGLAQPPKTWEALVAQTTPALTRLTDSRQVTQSAVAFGEYRNVAHAKDVLALLLLQAGSTLVNESSGTYSVTIGQEL